MSTKVGRLIELAIIIRHFQTKWVATMAMVVLPVVIWQRFQYTPSVLSLCTFIGSEKLVALTPISFGFCAGVSSVLRSPLPHAY